MHRTIHVDTPDKDRLAIHVEDTQASGPAVILVHGNSCSTDAFRKQLDGALGQRLRLIAVDLPGHGASSKATKPDATYTLAGYADTITEVARLLDVEDAVFLGWSLGGHVVFHSIPQLPRARGFFVFGAAPVTNPPQLDRMLVQHPAIVAAYRENSTDDEIRDLVARFFRPGTSLPDSFVESVRRADGRTRSCLAASIERRELRDELSIVQELPQKNQPLAIMFGVHDGILSADYLHSLSMPLWRGKVHVLDHVGHAIQWEDPSAFDATLEAFVTEANSPVAATATAS